MNTTRKIRIARKFRRESTDSEALLWDILHDRMFLGLKFRRQYVVQGFILDFYCPDLRLAIEIDGSIHEGQREEDNWRQKILEQAEIVFFRIPSKRVERDMDSVLRELASFIKTLLPLPLRDEGV